MMQTALVWRRWVRWRVRLDVARWELLAIPMLALVLYLPALRFGLMWDDPNWYQQGAGLSFWQLLGPVPSFQYYRPLALAYNRLFVDSAGLVHSWPRHLAQVSFHGLNVLLCMRLASVSGLGRWPTAATGLFLTVHPYAQQAVAWQAPQQPLATLAILGVVLWARRYLDGGERRWLVYSVALFGVGLLLQESVLGALAALMVVSWQRSQRGPRVTIWRRYRWLASYGALAAVYLVNYVLTPRYSGVTGSEGRLQVTAFMLQALLPPTGVLRPLVGSWSATSWLALGLLTLGLLTWAAWRRAPQAAFVGLALFVAGIAPAVLGLGWDYVSVGSRLAYPALPGVALLWAGALMPAGANWTKRAQYGTLLLALALTAAFVSATMRLQRMYADGTGHLQATMSVLAARPEETVLFINYPDRLALRRPPYAEGYWGLVLAPAVQQLDDYALAERGHSARTVDLTRLMAGTQPWEDSPYQVDWRGERVGAAGLAAPDAAYDAVFNTVIASDGALSLREVGWSQPVRGGERLAILGERLMLVTATASGPDRRTLHLELTVQAVGALAPDDTLFVHVLDASSVLVADADSDLWGGYLPLAVLPPTLTISEHREVDISALAPGDYAVTVGLYNRGTGERYAVAKPDGAPVWNDELQISTLHID